MQQSKYNSNLSFIDYLFFLLSAFMVLFILSFLQQIEEKAKGNNTDKAEFLLELTWTDGSKDDIDIWVRDPIGNVLYFKDKTIGFMNLDRDDMGMRNNELTTDDGQTITVSYRREVATIRAIVPGHYVVNLIMYQKISDGPIPSKLVFRKLNPYKEIVQKEVVFTQNGEEQTVITFDVTHEGDVVNISDGPSVSLMESKIK